MRKEFKKSLNKRSSNTGISKELETGLLNCIDYYTSIGGRNDTFFVSHEFYGEHGEYLGSDNLGYYKESPTNVPYGGDLNTYIAFPWDRDLKQNDTSKITVVKTAKDADEYLRRLYKQSKEPVVN